MMKILLLTDSLGPGGAQRQLVGLATMLKDFGYDVSIACYYDEPFYQYILDEKDIECKVVNKANSIILRIPLIYRFIKRESPDWVIAYQETPSLIVCVCKLLGIKSSIIVSERNTSQRIGLKEIIRFNLFRYADYIVPNSFAQANLLSVKYKWMNSKIHPIPNFVDLKRFSFQKRKRKTPAVILVVATLWESKNAKGLIEACSILKTKNDPFIIKWYGVNDEMTPYANESFSLLKDKGISSNFFFFNKIKDIEKAYFEADYFCLPSFYEGTPNVLCEAISTGLPVVCSNVCDNGIYVSDNVNGFLFDPNDPRDIAAAIERALILSEDEYSSFCNMSRHMAEDQLTPDIFIKRYLELLNKD